MKRLFIAIPVIPEQALLDIIARLKTSLIAEQINWVAPKNLHFTLQFLGDTPEDQIPALSALIRETSLQFKKTAGMLTGIDYFTRQGNPQVLFTKLENMPAMGEMASEIQKKMKQQGFTPDFREFKPHLTLGRIRYLRNKQGFYQLAATYKEYQIQPFVATEIILFESILRSEGPIYRPLFNFQLQ
jgi:RNA 2',3'-cyclic 3'-phosphodiesterase